MGGHESKNFLSPYPTDATYEIWSRLAYYFLEEIVNGSRTTDDDGRQPIAIGHLSDLDDLKTKGPKSSSITVTLQNIYKHSFIF